MRLIPMCAVLALCACKPPATDDYVERVDLAQTSAAVGEPLPSPDATDAVWAQTTADRIVYGIPGQVPFLALACDVNAAGAAQIHITRFAPADARAKALLALIGNGHIARLPVDAKWNGRAWLWEGSVSADDPRSEVLTGTRKITATLPGAGMLDLNPSPMPSQLVEACRQKQMAAAPPKSAPRQPQNLAE